MPHDWQINDESCYDAKFEYQNPAADGAEAVLTLTGFKEGWKQAMGDLLDGMADSWRWNVIDDFLWLVLEHHSRAVVKQEAWLARAFHKFDENKPGLHVVDGFPRNFENIDVWNK